MQKGQGRQHTRLLQHNIRCSNRHQQHTHLDNAVAAHSSTQTAASNTHQHRTHSSSILKLYHDSCCSSFISCSVHSTNTVHAGAYSRAQVMTPCMRLAIPSLSSSQVVR
jgi:hypothetical protein